MGLSKFNKNVENIIALDDNPNEGATPLTSAQLKERFDQAGVDIKDYINNTLTREIDNTVSGINDSISNLNTNLTGKIGSLENLTTTNKSNIVSAANEINAKLADTGWITIVPTNGTAGTGYYVPKYRKIGKQVTMRGYITVKNNNAMFTLPEAYRPSARLTFSGTNDNKNTNEIRIVETGDVRLLDTTGSLSSGVSCFLDNITYFVD